MPKVDPKAPRIFDKLGKEITQGCYIVYGHLLGRSAGLKVGKVLAIKPAPEGRFGEARITVRGVNDGWYDEKPSLSENKGTLQFPDRCLVVNESDLPKIYSSLFATVEE
jgi:hypothetical protein